jgi:transcriptional regulator with XRE-family HTH domain
VRIFLRSAGLTVLSVFRTVSRTVIVCVVIRLCVSMLIIAHKYPMANAKVSLIAFIGTPWYLLGMNKNSMSRLAILRFELGVTQRQLGDRAGLSLPYIKKLEQGTKPMSKRPAVAIAIATGVHWKWLAGEGAASRIMARLGMTDADIVSAVKNKKPSKELRDKLAEGVPWKKEMADAIQKYKGTPKTALADEQEQKIYRLRHSAISRQLGQIIQTAIRQKRAELCVARIEDFVRELAAEPWLDMKNAIAAKVQEAKLKAGNKS